MVDKYGESEAEELVESEMIKVRPWRMNMLLGSAALPMVIGILTALAYAFLKEQNPSNPLLKTPKFLKS